MSFGRDTSWRDVSKELVERARQEMQQAKQNPPVPSAEQPRRAVETSEAWGMSDEEPGLELGSGVMTVDSVQQLLFTPQQGGAQSLTVALSVAETWRVVEQALRHLRSHRPIPLYLSWNGKLDDMTYADGYDNANQEPDTVPRLEE
jgi:hypothetical protein